MARSPNPYRADAGPYNGIGEGIGNLGQLFFEQADPVREAQATQAAWQGREAREQARDLSDARRGRQQLGELYKNYSPENYDPAAIMGEAIGTGTLTPSEISQLLLTGAGNLPGMTDDQRTGALVGTGQTLTPTTAVSMGHQDDIAQRDQVFALEQQAAQDAGAMQRLQTRLASGGAGGSGGGGAGSAGGPESLGPVFGLSPDQGRWLDAQESMRGELPAILQSYGLPADDEGNVRTDLLPQGYFEGVLQQAADAARADNLTRDISFYLENALRNQDQVPGEYVEDDIPILGFGDENLDMVPGGEGVDPYFRQLFQAAQPGQQPAPQQSAPQQGGASQGPVQIQSDADYDALPSGTEFIGPDGVRRRKP